jgi:hypothetical protein
MDTGEGGVVWWCPPSLVSVTWEREERHLILMVVG